MTVQFAVVDMAGWLDSLWCSSKVKFWFPNL